MIGGGMHGFGGLGNFGWWGMALGLIINIGLIVGVVWLVVWVVKRVSTPNQGTLTQYGPVGGTPSPREILQTRYVRGEITREQYLEILADIN